MYRALTVATRLALPVLFPVAAAQTRGVFVTPIPNVPLLAVVNTQSSQIQKDGTIVNRTTLSAIARDGHGRIFNERRPLIPASETVTPPILSILIYNPQTRMSTFIDPRNRVASQSTLNRPPSSVPPEAGSIPLVGSTLPSQYLRLNMLAIHRDPRTGEQTTAVTQLDRGEPDPAIFEIPSDYKIIQRGAQ